MRNKSSLEGDVEMKMRNIDLKFTAETGKILKLVDS